MPTGVFAGVLLACPLVTDSYAQQRIGRLFSTPEQRMELDRIRSDPGAGEEATPVAVPTIPESPPESEPGLPAFSVTVDGVALRSDGHRVVWVNGVETEVGGKTPAGVGIEGTLAPSGRLRIRLPAGGRRVVLRSGQTIDVDGRVREAYERRSAGIAASGAKGHTQDAGGNGVGESTAARAESPESVTAPPVAEGLVPALSRVLRAASAPPGTAASDSGTTGGRPPVEMDSTGREPGN